MENGRFSGVTTAFNLLLDELNKEIQVSREFITPPREVRMTSRYSRRTFISRAIIGGTAFAASIPGLCAAAERAARGVREPFLGIFPIMQTPFRENFEIDEDAARREVNFMIAGGTHGITWPQLASEYYVLTDDERIRMAELIVKEARGRVPVIIGVQSTNWWKTSLKFARHAEAIGTQGIISLPPFTSNATMETTVEYFKTLARTVKLPIFIQNTGGQYGKPLPIDTMIDLATEFPAIAYVKEEAEPNLDRIAELASKGKGFIKGVFSGNGGVNLMKELPRGSAGTCPCAGLIDVFAQVYDAWVAGNRDKAQGLFDILHPMQTFDTMHWLVRDKEILRRRGIFTNTVMRIEPFKLVWSPEVEREFNHRYDTLKPYFTI